MRTYRSVLVVLALVVIGVLGGCGNGTSEPTVESIAVDPPTASIFVGEEQTFEATALYSDGHEELLTTGATWSSSDEAVATIDAATGVAAGVAEGTATITVTFEGASGTAQLGVGVPVVTEVLVTPGSASVVVGSTAPFTARAVYSDGRRETVTTTATWSSSDEAVATIGADGVATAVGAGSTAITATFGGITSDGSTLTVTDTTGITVDPTTGLVTTEAGDTDTFTVVLNGRPTADVTIALASSDEGEGTVSPAALTFTTDNWNAPQTVTVTGVDDDLADGDQEYTIETAAAVSDDDAYDGVDAADVEVSNTDDETPGVTVTPTTGLETTEAGGTATFTVVLNTQPTADVTIGLTSGDETEGTVSPTSLVFTDANWDAPQTVTVTGVDDDLVDGDQPYGVETAAAVSDDDGYEGIDPGDVELTNIDDDSPGVTVTPTTGLTTTEAGGTATFTVVLNAQPTADVTIGLSSSDPGEGTVSPASLTFTSENWAAPQTVTVT
ncbi:MAG: Ig-like domain-containing protein, partial [Deltaproteobacteria bacterium]|nr:Ig-like domain-containing protein [Deltaproteobacteria bacterium]